MQDIEEKDRLRLVLICAALMVVAYTAGNWAASQYIASLYGYSPDLPGHIYGEVFFPFSVNIWRGNTELMQIIGFDVKKYSMIAWIFYAIGGVCCYQVYRSMQRMTSHGTAGWAKKKDIIEAGLKSQESGFVVGINPFTKQLMLHNGPEHILLVAPTRSGKGVCNMIPTGICWKHSIFFFDPKGELWNFTAKWRQKAFGQKVMKFEPLCKDGSAAKWNPFAEIDFQSFEELTDVSTISEMMVKTGEGGGKDPFWENSAAALINGIILHLLYKHYQEKRLLPCPSDVMSFLSTPSMSTAKLFATMKMYPHISKDEFLERGGKKNVLKEVYGEYIEDFRPFAKACPEFKEAASKNEKVAREYERAISEGREDAPPPESNLELLQRTIRELEENEDISEAREFDFRAPDLSQATDKESIDKAIQTHIDTAGPWFMLLVHPKVAEAAANIYNGAEQTSASILQTAQTAMAVYQDPLVRKNTATSDFTTRDLLDPRQEVSLYLVLQPNDIEKLRPVLRLFINTMLAKLVRDMEFEEAKKKEEKADGAEEQKKKKKKEEKPKKQRLLLMLDEFPQLYKLESIERSLAICAGYGVKICIVAQSMGQLNKIYTKENAIPGNCHVQIYFTPTLEDGGGTARTLSETLGEKTIHSFSKSTTGEMFKGSTSTSNMARKLMTPDEVRRMPQDRELVFVAGFRAIYGYKLRYYEEPWFMQRIKPPPLFSDTATKIQSYASLFAVHAVERAKIEKKQVLVKEERTRAAERIQERKTNERTREILKRAEQWRKGYEKRKAAASTGADGKETAGFFERIKQWRRKPEGTAAGSETGSEHRGPAGGDHAETLGRERSAASGAEEAAKTSGRDAARKFLLEKYNIGRPVEDPDAAEELSVEAAQDKKAEMVRLFSIGHAEILAMTAKNEEEEELQDGAGNL